MLKQTAINGLIRLIMLDEPLLTTLITELSIFEKRPTKRLKSAKMKPSYTIFNHNFYHAVN